MSVRIILGDCRERLRELEAGSVYTCVTSPPYFGLRDYGTARWDGGDPDCDHVVVNARRLPGANDVKGPNSGGKNGAKYANVTKDAGGHCAVCGAVRRDDQIGLEDTPDAFVAQMVEVFREVRRVLRDDGTLWLNLGDSYAGSWGAQGHRVTESDDASWHGSQIKNHPKRGRQTGTIRQAGLKPKDLIGIPWRVAFALQADGWYLRQDIIWAKPNPMPESTRDRCTKSHEYLFLLSKSERYFYDADAVAEPAGWDPSNTKQPDGWDTGDGGHGSFHREGREKGAKAALTSRKNSFARATKDCGGVTGEKPQFRADREPVAYEGRRNKRSVWTVATEAFREAHFATYPQKLIEPCILAGSPPGGVVLDPFGGSGTTGLVASRLGRDAILIELNPDYAALADRRLRAGLAQVEGEAAVDPSDLPLFAGEAA